MAPIELVDETFIVAEPGLLGQICGDPEVWKRWWPELDLSVFMDRAAAGQRWNVTGALVGSSEVWLEPWHDGTIVHHYLRVDTAVPLGNEPRDWRRAARIRAEYARNWKATIWALKAELEVGRAAGEARVQLDGGTSAG